MNEMSLCLGCNKSAEEIEEYVYAARENELTPEEYLKQEEGTYNYENGHFLCTTCYIAAGMPSGPRGWIAP